MTKTLIDHERRLTAFELGLGQLAARLEKLEALADQTRVDREQAERREMAEVRRDLEQLRNGAGVAGR